MRRYVCGLAMAMLGGCAFAIDERVVFQPQEKTGSWGDQPNDGIAGERYFADAAGYPFEDHGLAARVRHEVVSGIQTSLVTLAEPPDEPRPLITHCFGNGSDRWFSGLNYGRKLVPYGDVLLFDYPGYNGADGEPTAAAFDAQADALSAHVTATYADRPRVYWGHSLGGFVCAELAARDPGGAALILETTAPDVRSVGASWLPWFAKPFIRLKYADSLLAYDTPGTAAASGLPILVIGAGRDDVLDVTLARDLARRLDEAGADSTYVELAEADHFDTEDQPGFDPAVRGFLEGALR